MDADEKIEYFDQIRTKDGMRNVGHNEGVGIVSIKAKIEFEQALAIGLNVRLVDSSMAEATVGPLTICVCIMGWR